MAISETTRHNLCNSEFNNFDGVVPKIYHRPQIPLNKRDLNCEPLTYKAASYLT